jgi:hypothetical protein
MLHLPLDIIEKIIISSDTILITHNTILTLVKILLSNYNNYQLYHKYQHYLSLYHFLSNNKTILNIYTHSRWYNFFINNQKQYNNITINNINKNIIHNLNIVKTFVDIENVNDNVNEIDDNYIERINYIDLNVNNINFKLLIQDILHYWNIKSTDLGSFILLIIVLLSSTTFKTNMNNLYIENHLYMKFIKEKEDISSNMNMNIHIPCYFNPNNKIIPLFQKYIGLGFTYNIAWDLTIRKYIGFLCGGASAEDFYYCDTKLQLYLQKNKTERLKYIKKYKKLININKLIENLVLDDKSISYYEQICIN